MKIILIILGAILFITAIFNLIKHFTEHYKEYQTKLKEFAQTLVRDKDYKTLKAFGLLDYLAQTNNIPPLNEEAKTSRIKALKRKYEENPTEENKDFYQYYKKWQKTTILYVPLSLILFVVAIALFIIAEKVA